MGNSFSETLSSSSPPASSSSSPPRSILNFAPRDVLSHVVEFLPIKVRLIVWSRICWTSLASLQSSNCWKSFKPEDEEQILIGNYHLSEFRIIMQWQDVKSYVNNERFQQLQLIKYGSKATKKFIEAVEYYQKQLILQNNNKNNNSNLSTKYWWQLNWFYSGTNNNISRFPPLFTQVRHLRLDYISLIQIKELIRFWDSNQVIFTQLITLELGWWLGSFAKEHYQLFELLAALPRLQSLRWENAETYEGNPNFKNRIDYSIFTPLSDSAKVFPNLTSLLFHTPNDILTPNCTFTLNHFPLLTKLGFINFTLDTTHIQQLIQSSSSKNILQQLIKLSFIKCSIPFFQFNNYCNKLQILICDYCKNITWLQFTTLFLINKKTLITLQYRSNKFNLTELDWENLSQLINLQTIKIQSDIAYKLDNNNLNISNTIIQHCFKSWKSLLYCYIHDENWNYNRILCSIFSKSLLIFSPNNPIIESYHETSRLEFKLIIGEVSRLGISASSLLLFHELEWSAQPGDEDFTHVEAPGEGLDEMENPLTFNQTHQHCYRHRPQQHSDMNLSNSNSTCRWHVHQWYDSTKGKWFYSCRDLFYAQMIVQSRVCNKISIPIRFLSTDVLNRKEIRPAGVDETSYSKFLEKLRQSDEKRASKFLEKLGQSDASRSDDQ